MSNDSRLNKLSCCKFNEENPFLKQAVQEFQKHVVKKHHTASSTGKKAILQAVDDNGKAPYTTTHQTTPFTCA